MKKFSIDGGIWTKLFFELLRYDEKNIRSAIYGKIYWEEKLDTVQEILIKLPSFL